LEMKCVWVPDKETGIACGNPAEIRRNLTLCAEHELLMLGRSGLQTATITQTLKYHELSDFPGYCYVVLLSNGSVKIGYTNTAEFFLGRLRAIHKDHDGPVVVLSVFKGGCVAEHVMHNRFRDSRISGEVFAYSPELAALVTELGVDESCKDSINKYAAYVAKKTI